MCVINPSIAKTDTAETQDKAKIAIIIDDIGGKPSDIAAFALPKDVTFAILPNTAYSTSYSHMAAKQGREVMLHMPMESLHGGNLGPNPLMSTMYPEEQIRNLSLALQNVPHAVGVNNHMGSKLTQITLSMKTVMQELAQRELFFIDSVTTRFSKAHDIAEEYGVNYATRHIFLDHEQNEGFVAEQFDRLVAIAQTYGVAIAIAHPYSVTLDVLPELIEALPNDIELVTVDSIMNQDVEILKNDKLVKNQLRVLQFAPNE
ncbi:MAG: divergent polysaccharide deacetylase family protein [Pseudomonadota bacterium]